jgi:ADP-ribosyl-[dinitrogen reductase] hydrolase
MDADILDRARACALGAAIGDALGMPLEFAAPQPPDRLLREMRAGRLPAGAFTDDTEMALALADSLLATGQAGLDPDDLARRLAAWLDAGPDDVGRHTRLVVGRISAGQTWQQASGAVQTAYPDSAGNGSVMRCWPVALARWDDLDALITESLLQSRVTHAHDESGAACALVNAIIFHLMRNVMPDEAVGEALSDTAPPPGLRDAVEAAPDRRRSELENSGWVRHTIESAIWGLLTTDSFEEALVQVANLGGDADTAASVVGALAGAAYGLDAIPARWRDALRGEWPIGSGERWDATRFIALADQLVGV